MASGLRKRSFAAALWALATPTSGVKCSHWRVEVRDLDLVGVDDPQPPHPGARQVGGDRRAERARADDEHAGLPQRQLRRSLHSGRTSWRE